MLALGQSKAPSSNAWGLSSGLKVGSTEHRDSYACTQLTKSVTTLANGRGASKVCLSLSAQGRRYRWGSGRCPWRTCLPP